jgi:hypothetical protein
MRYALVLLLACGSKQHDAPPPPVADAKVEHPTDATLATIDAAPAAGAVAIKLAGGDAFCAVMSDRSLRCWHVHGDVETMPLHGVIDVVIAGDTACALLDDHSVSCWGDIGWQNGDKTTLAPTGVTGVIGVKKLFVQPRRGCATTETDAFVCWGDVDAKGHPTVEGRRRQPTPVVGIDHVIAMTTGGVLRDDGSVLAWGADGDPVRVALTGGNEMAERANTTCVRTKDDVRCFGSAAICAACPPGEKCIEAKKPPPPPPPKKKPAKGKKEPPPPPLPAGPPPGLPTAPLAVPAGSLALAAGWCVLTPKQEVSCGTLCIDKQPDDELGQSVLLRKLKVQQIAGHCARISDGSVQCWDGSQLKSLALKATSIVASSSLTCAIVEGGSVWCWGSDRKPAKIL